jgi:hypothetical protein
MYIGNNSRSFRTIDSNISLESNLRNVRFEIPYLHKTSVTNSIALCSLSFAESASSPGISTNNRRTKLLIPLLTRWFREDMITLSQIRCVIQFAVDAMHHFLPISVLPNALRWWRLYAPG